MSAPDFLTHKRAKTGRWRFVPRSEVESALLDAMTPILAEIDYWGQERAIPGFPGWEWQVWSPDRATLVAHVGSPLEPLVLTFAVAVEDVPEARTAWRNICNAPDVLSPLDSGAPPAAPWLLTARREGALAHSTEALAWLPDFCRCVAWGWVEGRRADRSAAEIEDRLPDRLALAWPLGTRVAVAEAAAADMMTPEEWLRRTIRAALEMPPSDGARFREAEDASVEYGPDLSVVWEEWMGMEHLAIKVPVDDDTSNMLEEGLWVQGTEIFMAWNVVRHIGSHSTTEDIAHAAERCVEALRPLVAAMKAHWKAKAVK